MYTQDLTLFTFSLLSLLCQCNTITLNIVIVSLVDFSNCKQNDVTFQCLNLTVRSKKYDLHYISSLHLTTKYRRYLVVLRNKMFVAGFKINFYKVEFWLSKCCVLFCKNPFYAKILFMQKSFLCKNTFYAKILFMQKYFLCKNPFYAKILFMQKYKPTIQIL